jgi:signal transduction histidine kinase
LLRPSMLDDLGLIPALRWQAREASKRCSFNVNLSAEGVPDDLPDEYKTCIYRIVQEAINNCARHSQATDVAIRVEAQPEKLILSIQDNGRGFDVHQVRGLGLLGIQERVAGLGGRFEVQSVTGNGTLLSIELPFDGATESVTEYSDAVTLQKNSRGPM